MSVSITMLKYSYISQVIPKEIVRNEVSFCLGETENTLLDLKVVVLLRFEIYQYRPNLEKLSFVFGKQGNLN